MLFFTSAGSWQGATLLAVNTILMQMFLLVSYVMDGFANAAEAMSGKFYGAADNDALKDTIHKSFLWGGGCALVFTGAYVFGGDLFVRLLTDEPMVLSAATDYMVWICIVPFVSFAAFIWDGIYIGLTAARSMLLATFVAAVCFYIVYVSTRTSLGNHGLWLAFLCFLFMRGAMQSMLYLSKKVIK
jgi:MATE family multidrug resistance protein